MLHFTKAFYSLLFLLLFSPGAIAQQDNLAVHTIQLNYRQAEEVMSLLKPFLHPKGIMTGEGSMIMVKTTARNYRDLLQIVAEIDVAQRQFRVSVTVDPELARRENEVMHAANAQTKRNEALANMVTEEYALERRNQSATTQQVQVQEGKWANISSGETIPVTQRIRNPDGTVTESINYKSVNNRLEVLPRVSGDRVTLFIRPERESAQGGDRVKASSTETTISGKLNQWILISGEAKPDVNQAGAQVNTTGKRTESYNQLFVKVEVIQ